MRGIKLQLPNQARPTELVAKLGVVYNCNQNLNCLGRHIMSYTLQYDKNKWWNSALNSLEALVIVRKGGWLVAMLMEGKMGFD